jgi:hypothetical protein
MTEGAGEIVVPATADKVAVELASIVVAIAGSVVPSLQLV